MTHILIECQQGTPEWFAARAGVITASKFADAVGKLKNGNPSQASKDYAYKVAVEIIYGQTTEDTYQTFEMRRGTELEPIARMVYERTTGNMAEESGLVLTEDRRFGYSTDGFVDSDGLIEIKCPNSARKIVEIWESATYRNTYTRCKVECGLPGANGVISSCTRRSLSRWASSFL